MTLPPYPLVTVYEKSETGYMSEIEEIELPPPGVGRMAAIYKYKPEGGSVVDIDEDHIGFFDAEGNLVRLIG